MIPRREITVQYPEVTQEEYNDFNQKGERSQFKFIPVKSSMSVGKPGDGGVDLISVNSQHRLMAIGCVDSVLLCSTFWIHFLLASDDEMPVDAKSRLPSVVIPLGKSPLQISIQREGKYVGIRTETSFLCHTINRNEKRDFLQASRATFEKRGVFSHFEFVNRLDFCVVGLLNHEGLLNVVRIGDKETVTCDRVVSFAFNPSGTFLCVGGIGEISIYSVDMVDMILEKKEILHFPKHKEAEIKHLHWHNQKGLFFCMKYRCGLRDIPDTRRTQEFPFFLTSKRDEHGTIQRKCRTLYSFFDPQPKNNFRQDEERRHVGKENVILRSFEEEHMFLGVCTNSERVEVFENFEDGYSNLRFRKGQRVWFKTPCLGYDVDYTYRMAVGDTPEGAVCVWMETSGQVRFARLVCLDERSGKPVKSTKFENFDSMEEKMLYHSHWTSMYQFQQSFTTEDGVKDDAATQTRKLYAKWGGIRERMKREGREKQKGEFYDVDLMMEIQAEQRAIERMKARRRKNVLSNTKWKSIVKGTRGAKKDKKTFKEKDFQWEKIKMMREEEEEEESVNTFTQKMVVEGEKEKETVRVRFDIEEEEENESTPSSPTHHYRNFGNFEEEEEENESSSLSIFDVPQQHEENHTGGSNFTPDEISEKKKLRYGRKIRKSVLDGGNRTNRGKRFQATELRNFGKSFQKAAGLAGSPSFSKSPNRRTRKKKDRKKR